MPAKVYVVHCVDTEGPLYEDLEAKFERLENILGLPWPKHTHGEFERLKSGEVDLGGKEDLIKKIFSSHLAGFNGTWRDVELMLERTLAPEALNRLPDSFGGAYRFSWFILDIVGFDTNPRRRAFGYHAVFDFYCEFFAKHGLNDQGLHFHFHPISTYREGHRCGLSLLNSPHIWETLARRIIERRWFPSCVRCGYQAERPDIHWFLEQYLPFDFTNTAVEDASELEAQADLAAGRFGDWRLAPTDWGVYHPSHDNYQLPGSCRRLIARSLNIMNRFASIDQSEVDKAFAQAASGRPALLAVASHDHRDLGPEAEHFRELLAAAAKRYPQVPFEYADALTAIRQVAFGGESSQPPLELEVELTRDAQGRPAALEISTKQGKVFGPQPFLAIKTRSQRFIHDNLDFSTDLKNWRYVFDVESVLPNDVAAVGVGAADAFGHTVVKVLDLDE